MCATESRVMPFMSTKSGACISTLRPLGKVMQGRKRSSRRFQTETNQLRETTLTENIGSPVLLGVGRGADNSSMAKKKVMKTEEATAGRTLLRRAGNV
jgi:hypothetical protein